MSENLEYVASNIHHFSDFEGILKYKPKFRHFFRTNHQKKLKTVDVLWKLNCLCCGNVFFIFCFDGIFDEIWRQIQAYFVFCFSNQNISNFPIPVLVELTEAKTISYVWLLNRFIVCRTFFYFFNFCPKNLEHVASNIHHFSDFEGILK